MDDEKCGENGCKKKDHFCTVKTACAFCIEEARASALRENNEMWEKRVEAHGASQYQAGFEAGDRTGRADERAKCEEHLICPMCKEHICKHSKSKMVEHQERLIKEAYAKGKADGRLEGMKEQHAIEYKDKNEAYEHGKVEGQADMIDKIHHLFGKIPPHFPIQKLRHGELHDAFYYCEEIRRVLEKASESLGAKGSGLCSETDGEALNPKAIGKGLPANPKPEKPKTILQRDRDVRDSRGQKVKR